MLCLWSADTKQADKHRPQSSTKEHVHRKQKQHVSRPIFNNVPNIISRIMLSISNLSCFVVYLVTIHNRLNKLSAQPLMYN